MTQKRYRAKRDRLAIHFQTVVARTARQLLRKMPRHWDREEIEGFGQVALLQALDSYRVKRGELESYLIHKIRFGILDQLRTADASRRIGPRPTFKPIREENDLLEYPYTTLPDEIPVDAHPNPEQCVIARDIWRKLKILPNRSQRIMVLYYRDEWTMRMIAEYLGLSVGRISQLHSRGLACLRKEVS